LKAGRGGGGGGHVELRLRRLANSKNGETHKYTRWEVSSNPTPTPWTETFLPPVVVVKQEQEGVLI